MNFWHKKWAWRISQIETDTVVQLPWDLFKEHKN